MSKEEILAFISKMGPSKGEMTKEVEFLFGRYDADGRGTLELPEFEMLLADLDKMSSPGARRKKLAKSPTWWASVLVVLAGFCAFLSALLVALMGGDKKYGSDNGVLPFAVTREGWKSMDYPKVGMDRGWKCMERGWKCMDPISDW